MNSNDYTTNLVSKQGGQWQVLRWDWEPLGQYKEWTQVGPYWDTQAEAEDAIERLSQESVWVCTKCGSDPHFHTKRSDGYNMVDAYCATPDCNNYVWRPKVY